MSVDGIWKNELGSVLDLTGIEGHMTIEGNYQTNVSSKGEPLPKTDISGNWQRTDDGYLVGFSAQWKFEKDGQTKYSTTSWSGVISDDDPNTMFTTWILTSSDEPKWKNTNIGKDTFTRQ